MIMPLCRSSPLVSQWNDTSRDLSEDIEQLRATSLTEDLQKLVSGASLLRQGRTLSSKIFFYKREIWRTLNWAMANSHKPEAVATMVAFVAVLSVVLLGLVLIIITCRSGFPEDADRKRKWPKNEWQGKLELQKGPLGLSLGWTISRKPYAVGFMYLYV